ncbi:predicted protein [Nematostella vectensis]|uniref:FAD dependent oxidoreductase domain-containing protein n=1 Tax=Nematostella vectensis TaxID=45351 RepID=A7SJI0_NEMVE|nr:predicted protein [Nematostella vectensis]|eukprot:XP_001628166.1 predicted protein [Nematostella vectensis]
MAPRVAVVGCGVIGATSALEILQSNPSVRLTVIADTFSPENTSDGAAGLLMPFAVGETDPGLVRRWFKETMRRFEELLRSEIAPELGVFRASGCLVADHQQEIPDWKDLVYGFKQMSREELERFPLSAKIGFVFETIIAQGSYYIPWLMKRIQHYGGKIVKRRLDSFQELARSFDVVVNCCGLGAKGLAQDRHMFPIRGQILRVKAPWIKQFILYEKYEDLKAGRLNDIIPQMDHVVLGGCAQAGSFNTVPTLQDTVNIIEDTSKVIPALKNAEVISNWSGLRPGRKTVRLEKEVMLFKDESGCIIKLNVVHNYGHGGAGPSLSFGCAKDTADLVAQILSRDAKSML